MYSDQIMAKCSSIKHPKYSVFQNVPDSTICPFTSECIRWKKFKIIQILAKI